MKIKLLLIRYDAVITDDGVLKHDLVSLVLSLLAVLVEICTTTYFSSFSKLVKYQKKVHFLTSEMH